jgi:hypothetical protein
VQPLGARQAAQLVVAVALGVVAYVVLPRIAVDPDSLLLAALRGALAGSVVALTLGGAAREWVVVALAAVAAAAGTVVLGVASVATYGTGLVGVLAALVLAALVGRAGRWASPISLVVVASAMLVSSGIWGGPVGQVEAGREVVLHQQPQAGQYEFDGFVFLRTLDLMRNGSSYYAAFARAIRDERGLDPTPLASPFNFREPFLFHLWKVLPGGDLPMDLLGWFLVLAVVMQLAAYVVARRWVPPGPALVAPLLLVPYLSFFLRHNVWFTMVEIWAAGFALVALAFLVRGRWVPSLVMLVVAVATRELMVLFVPVWLLAWWLWSPPSKRRWWIPAVAIVGPLVVLGLHWALAPTVSGPGGDGIDHWLTGPSLGRLRRDLTFAWAPVVGATAVALLVPLAALVGPLVTRPRRAALPLTCLVAVPLVFLLCVSSGPTGAYWGAILTPLAIALAPSVLAVVFPREPEPAPVAG